MTHRFQTEQWVPFPIEKVFLFFANPHNLPRITPPGLNMKIERITLVAPPPMPSSREGAADSSSLAGTGSAIVTSFRLLPFVPLRATWTSLIIDFAWNQYFVDVQEKGVFKSFRHKHGFETLQRAGLAGTVVRDSIEYEVGFSLLGEAARRLFVARQLSLMFSHRQRTLEALLRSDPNREA